MYKNYFSLGSGKDTMLKKRSGHVGSPPPSGLYRLWLVMLLLSLSFGQAAWAQSTANYSFAASTTGSLEDMSSGTTQILAAGVDDTVSALTSFNLGAGAPFDFYFMGVRYSQFGVSDNGILTLGVVPGTTVYAIPNSTVPTLAPFGNDMRMGTNGAVEAKVLGTAPNRTLVVQWTNVMIRYLNPAAAGTATFQVRLYESSGVVEYAYGTMATNSSGPTVYYVGFSSNTTSTRLLTVNTTTSAASTVTPAVSNTYTASSTITALNSAADGSRKVFSFTPPAITPADPITLSFTAVTATTTTLNWLDNSTDENLFVVTRATDAGFTQNVTNTTVPSTTTAATGGSYLLAQTGLAPGTTYYYRITAATEGGVQGVGLTGSQGTTAGSTYYWTGATGGNWNTFANWNTAADGTGTVPTAWDNTDIHVIDGEGTTSGGVLSIVVDRTSFTIGQIRIIGNTNLTLASSATTTRTMTISGGPGDDFVLEAGSSLNLTSPTNAVAFAFSSSGNTGLIAGTYVASGSTSNVITTTGGTGTLMVVAGTGSVTSNLNSSSAALVGSIPTLRFENGSNYNHAVSTTVNYIPTATWLPMATATLNGNTTGTSLTSSSTSLGNLIINTTLSTATFSAFTTTSRIIQGNLTINNTGTGRFRAVTSGILQINGNLLINGGIFEVGSTTGGGVIVKGNTIVAPGAILDLNQSILQNEGNLINDGSILSSETTANSSLNFLGTGVAQTLSGTGTFTGRVSSLGVSNPLGLTISTPVLTQRVNLFSGTITGSSNITIGTGLALAGAVQIGSATNTTSGGNFDVSPVFNLGTGTYTLLYLGETTARTTGFEVPASRSVTTLTVNNANGLTIAGGTITVLNALNLTNGIVTSTLANHIIHGSATAAGTLTGGSATSYISGPIVRTIASGNTGYVFFPVGKGTYAPIELAPTTTAVSGFRAETFDSNSGSADASIVALSSTRRWETSLVSGAFTDINVKLRDAGLVMTSIPVQAPTAAGVYTNAFGSIATYLAGPPATTQSGTAVTAANFTGFISYADSNVCSGTPAPGMTLATATQICLGTSVTLSLQNATSGTGVSYVWESSADGVAYAPIADANGTTLTVAPTAETFYRAKVTCGANTGESTAVQITFNNTISGTTPGSRCGVGTVNLEAVGSAGTTISWYNTLTGGNSIGTGPTFTTPSISANTTYYAAAESAVSGNASIGAGASTSSTAPAPFNGGYGSLKGQYLFTAAELQAAGLLAGNITNLALDFTGLGGPFANFEMSVGHSALTSFPTAGNIQGGLTTVYTNPSFTPIMGVNNFAFGTGTGAASFNWDGTSNIVVSICWHFSAIATSGPGATVKTDTVPGGLNVSQSYRKDTEAAPCAFTGSTGVGTFSFSVSAVRPKMIFGGQIVCSSTRTAVLATVTTPPALTLSTANTAICNGANSAAVTITSNVADYDTYIWSPAEGVSGNSTTGWIFNPTVTTTYTLTASQSAGSMCVETTTVTVTVNPNPTPITFATVAPTVCTESIQALTANGGTIGSNESSTIGTATTLTIENSTDPTAFNNRYEHYWLQMVFTQAELNAAGVQAGNVNGIKFEIATIGSAPNVTDFKVRLGSTAVNTLTGFIPAGLTQVYSTPVYTQAIGVNAIVFNTPYVWDGTSNIIVDIRSTGADSINNAQTFFTATTDNKTVSAVTTATFPNSDAFAASNPAGTLSLKRLNTTFDWSNIIPTEITWAPATNLYSDAAATVAYVAGTAATTVYFKSNAVGTVNYTATAASTNCSVNAITSVNVVDCGIPYANLQFPGVATIGTCVSPTYYARVYKAGVTEAAGQGAGITAWIGKHNANTDPSTWPEASWELATFNVQSGNDDEYQATFDPSAAGTYYVASRFVFTPGQFVYGGYSAGGGGIWNGTSNVSGVLTVEATPAPTASAQTFCNAATVADLMATGTALQWYADATGGTALASTTALASGDYYVSQTLNTCEGPRTTVAVTVNVTAEPTASAQTFCNSATVADLMATGTALQWYVDATGGTALASTTALATGDYYVSQTLNGCESPRTTVAVTVNVTAAPTGAATQDFTSGDTLSDFDVTGQNIIWYDAATNGNVLPGTTPIVSGTVYYASQTVSGCESTNRLQVTAGVDLRNPGFDTASLKYYPNPVSDILTIDYSDAIDAVEVYNMLGQRVYYNTYNSQQVKIDMSAMASGNYIINVNSKGLVKNIKVIKK